MTSAKVTTHEHTDPGSALDIANSNPAAVPPGFYFDSKEHAYFLDGKPLHGITTVLGVIAKPALVAWAANQAVEYIKENCPLDTTGLEVGLRHVTDAQLGNARIAHRKKKEDAAEKGTDLHALVESYVQWCIDTNQGKAKQYFTPGIELFVNWAIDNNIRFLASEQRLYSKEHWVAGTCDLVFEKDGKTYIGDVKTYKKIWDRTPFFQCAAYGMMWEEMNKDSITRTVKDIFEGDGTKDVEITESPEIDGYCVLRLSKDGTFEAKWSFDIDGDRTAFLNALGLYKALKAYKA
jgi:hypothetical protein